MGGRWGGDTKGSWERQCWMDMINIQCRNVWNLQRTKIYKTDY